MRSGSFYAQVRHAQPQGDRVDQRIFCAYPASEGGRRFTPSRFSEKSIEAPLETFYWDRDSGTIWEDPGATRKPREGLILFNIQEALEPIEFWLGHAPSAGRLGLDIQKGREQVGAPDPSHEISCSQQKKRAE